MPYSEAPILEVDVLSAARLRPQPARTVRTARARRRSVSQEGLHESLRRADPCEDVPAARDLLLLAGEDRLRERGRGRSGACPDRRLERDRVHPHPESDPGHTPSRAPAMPDAEGPGDGIPPAVHRGDRGEDPLRDPELQGRIMDLFDRLLELRGTYQLTGSRAPRIRRPRRRSTRPPSTRSSACSRTPGSRTPRGMRESMGRSTSSIRLAEMR